MRGYFDGKSESLSLEILDELNLQSSHDYFCFQTTLASVESQLGNTTEANRLAESSRRLAQEIGLTAEHARVRIRENLALLRHL